MIAALALAACGGSKGVSGLSSSAVPDRNQAVADGRDAVTVTATVLQDGKPLAGATVTLTATGKDNQISPARTDANGTAHVSLSSTVAEEKILSLEVTSAGKTTEAKSFATVRFVAGPAASVRFDVQPTDTTAGSPFAAPVAVSVVDAQGNPVLDPTVHVALALEGHTDGVVPGTEAVDTAGEHQFNDFAVTQAGIGLHLIAEVPGLAPARSDAFAIAAAAPDASRSWIDLDRPSVVADGHDVVTGRFHLTDAFGNPIAGVAATLGSDGAQDVLSAQATATTSDGPVPFELSTRSSGTRAVTASAAGLSVSATLKAMPRFALGRPPMVDVFRPEPLVSTDSNAWAVASTAADFDGDGATDLAMAANWVDHLAVVYNQGDGTFQRPVSLGSGLAPVWVGAADVDGDLKPDLVAIDAGGTVSFFRNEGGRSFAPAQTLALGRAATGLPVVADLDSDGAFELLIPGPAGVDVVRGNGLGGLELGSPIPSPAQVSQVSVGDLNSDGVPDLALMTSNTDVVVMIADGAGGFTAGATYPVRALEIALADVTGDGPVDLVAVTYTGLAVYPGDGSGVFDTSPASVPVAPESGGLVIADLNGDGFPEIILPSSQQGVNVYAGAPGGPSGAPQTWPVKGFMMSAADFDGDGNLDLLSTEILGAEITPGDGAGGFRIPAESPSPITSYGVTIADLDNDGHADLVERSTAPEVATSLGNGDGTFGPATTFTPPTRLYSLQVLDLDADGYADLLARSSGGGLLFFPGMGDGSFGAMSVLPLVNPNAAFAAVDMDGDGRMDVVTAGDYDVQVLLANGDGTFRDQSYGERGATNMCVGDFDGDHHPDVAVAYLDFDKVEIRRGLEGGGLSDPVQVIPAVFDAYGAPIGMQCADVTHDGISELFFNDAAGTVRTFSAGADGQLVEGQALHGWNISPDQLRDLDQDGNLDLIVNSPDGLGVWLGNGKGQFTWYGQFAAPLDGQAAIGPVDGVPGDDMVQVDLRLGVRVVSLNRPY